MKIIKFTLILTTFLSSFSFADEIITGRYCYTYGDKESLIEAREITRTLAIRNAIESYRIYVEATTKINNFMLTNDIIQTISSGYLREIKVLNHTEVGRTICETISCKVDPNSIEEVLKKSVRNRIESVESTGINNNGYLKILSVRNDEKNNCISVSTKILVTITEFRDEHVEKQREYGPPKLSWTPEQAEKYKIFVGSYPSGYKPKVNDPYLKIYITYFDESGAPIDGDSKSFVKDESDPTVASGEIRCISFCNIPDRTKSYKVWLYKKEETKNE